MIVKITTDEDIVDYSYREQGNASFYLRGGVVELAGTGLDGCLYCTHGYQPFEGFIAFLHGPRSLQPHASLNGCQWLESELLLGVGRNMTAPRRSKFACLFMAVFSPLRLTLWRQRMGLKVLRIPGYAQRVAGAGAEW
jgi:hypothetical protein